ncbi:subtilase family protease [Shewanella psychrophila]|uniref:Subtilase family protease n=1 Tax=Shewanella psychrophila TaxID=225848 RepID=A0A1S6HKZ5_9GAMM|nr:subtilase family protease [Shewanella psychrophila]
MSILSIRFTLRVATSNDLRKTSYIDRLPSFSQFTSQVEISAPGEAILSTVTLGEGRLADISVEGHSYFENGIVPHSRYSFSDMDMISSPVFGDVTATLALCSTTEGKFNCQNMKDKICLVERIGNQGDTFPEIDAVRACGNAGASAVIVYSNAELPGLQNPFLVDEEDEFHLVSVSVDRSTGQALAAQVGSTVTISNTDNEDYEYYNGTSMATPHASGIATLVWSYHPECSAAQIRVALDATAEDLQAPGRDIYTGFGLINAPAAKAFLDVSCDGPVDGPFSTRVNDEL